MSPLSTARCSSPRGAETDLDLRHYERFQSSSHAALEKLHHRAESVIEKECCGQYFGGTAQVVPHITDEIKAFIKHDANVAIVEPRGARQARGAGALPQCPELGVD
jgi:CTP synthase (UTP-ammonia lyase)